MVTNLVSVNNVLKYCAIGLYCAVGLLEEHIELYYGNVVYEMETSIHLKILR